MHIFGLTFQSPISKQICSIYKKTTKTSLKLQWMASASFKKEQ